MAMVLNLTGIPVGSITTPPTRSEQSALLGIKNPPMMDHRLYVAYVYCSYMEFSNRKDYKLCLIIINGNNDRLT
jgi:hypothetical protein